MQIELVQGAQVRSLSLPDGDGEQAGASQAGPRLEQKKSFVSASVRHILVEGEGEWEEGLGREGRGTLKEDGQGKELAWKAHQLTADY